MKSMKLTFLVLSVFSISVSFAWPHVSGKRLILDTAQFYSAAYTLGLSPLEVKMEIAKRQSEFDRQLAEKMKLHELQFRQARIDKLESSLKEYKENLTRTTALQGEIGQLKLVQDNIFDALREEAVKRRTLQGYLNSATRDAQKSNEMKAAAQKLREFFLNDQKLEKASFVSQDDSQQILELAAAGLSTDEIDDAMSAIVKLQSQLGMLEKDITHISATNTPDEMVSLSRQLESLKGNMK